MKKYLYLFVCMVISLTFFVGCGNKNNSNSAIPKDTSKTASSQPNETNDWEPSAHKTVNNFKGVTMTVKGETASSTGLTIAFENNSGSQCIYGEYFCLEKKINGNWYQAPVIIDGNYGFDSIGYDLSSGDSGEWAVDWKWLYGSLDTGEYRIVKDILDFRGTGNYDTYYLAAEFQLL